MKTTRTIELTVESSQFFIRRPERRRTLAWCEPCGAHVQMVTPEVAALRAGVSVRAVYQKLEAGQIHCLETSESPLLICIESLDEVHAA